MEATDTRDAVSTDEGPAVSADEGPRVSAHHTCPDRVVFTEEGNNDGWIATDVTVDPER